MEKKLKSIPAHTYSIVAVDEEAGEMGVAVQSHWFSVGTAVPWIESGVGAVATQSFTNPAFGPEGLAYLKEGLSPAQIIEKFKETDDGIELRQVAVINIKGEAASFTGSRCVKDAGNIAGKGYSVQANLMKNDRVWPSMAETFEKRKGPLAERMLLALEEAEVCGGDLRGRQSAVLVVYRLKSSGHPWEDRIMDLRVEDHPAPLEELRRLLSVFRAYEHMEAREKAVEMGDFKIAEEEYKIAQKACPDNLEMHYWYAAALVNSGEVSAALPKLRYLFKEDSNWRLVLERSFEAGLIKCSKEELEEILA